MAGTGGRRRRGVSALLAAATLAVGAAACGGGSPSTRQALEPSPRSSSPSSAGCQTTPTAAPGVPGLDLRGRSSSDTTLYALLFPGYPVPARREAKFAWRMTGSGAIALYAVGPDGQRLSPAWGPDEHAGSNWRRPGDEWGAGFTFPVAGCWMVHATRGPSTATLGIRVVSG